MDWKEFFSKYSTEDLFEGNPLVQLFLKDGTCIQGRLLDTAPFVVVESNMRTDEDCRPTGRVWIAGPDDMIALKLIIPERIPDTWQGFEEALKENNHG